MGIPVAHRKGHLPGALAGGAQQFLGLLHPFACDVLGEGHAHLLAEHRRQIVGTDADLPRHLVEGETLVGVVFLQIEHRLPEEAAALAAGGVVPQMQRLEQDLQQAGPQRLGRDRLAQQLPVLQAVGQLGRVTAQFLQEARGAEVGPQRQILPQCRGIQRVAHVAQVLLHKALGLVGVGGFQKAAQDGGVHFGGVQRRQIAAALLPAQEGGGLLGQNVLFGQNVPVGPQPGQRFKAAGQRAEPGHRGGNRHVPVGRRALRRVDLLDQVHRPPGPAVDAVGGTHDEHQIGIQPPVEQQVFGVLQEVGHQGVPDAQIGLGEPLLPQGTVRRGGEKSQGVPLGPHVQLQPLGLLVDLRHAQRAAHHLLHELQPGVLLILLGFQAEPFEVVFLLGLALDLLLDLGEHLGQGTLGHRLQQIPLHPQIDGLAGIVEVVISRQDDDLGVGEFLQHQLAQLQPVHEGHPDVGNQHIGLHLPQQGQRHLAVPGLPHELVPHLIPGHRVPQGFPDRALVLYQKDPQHSVSFPLPPQQKPPFSAAKKNVQK